MEKTGFFEEEELEIRATCLDWRGIYILVGTPIHDIIYGDDVYYYDYRSYADEESLQYIGSVESVDALNSEGFEASKRGACCRRGFMMLLIP